MLEQQSLNNKISIFKLCPSAVVNVKYKHAFSTKFDGFEAEF
jgi:hypothetical protein